jgi:hypothetical protein
MTQRHPRAGPAAVPGTDVERILFAQIPELIRKIGGRSYGEVSLASNALGTWRAVKIVYRHNFPHDRPAPLCSRTIEVTPRVQRIESMGQPWKETNQQKDFGPWKGTRPMKKLEPIS